MNMPIPSTLRQGLLLWGLLLGLLAQAQDRDQQKHLDVLGLMLAQSEVFQAESMGFALYDIATGKYWLERDADKYYTPASNTKIFTLYTALKVLGDSLPAYRYAEAGDSLIIWGTGNPLLLHPDLPQDPLAWARLQDTSFQLFLSTHHREEERFGPGWAWDDYRYDFQAERSSFPLYGNLAQFYRLRTREGFAAQPPYFQTRIAYGPEMDNARPAIVREEHRNRFQYNDGALSGFPFSRDIPFRTSLALAAELLSDTLGRPVGLVDLRQLPPLAVYTQLSPLPDTLYRRLMQDSDNFLAEQLLLACSERLFGRQSAADAIRYAQDSLLASTPSPLLWRDGSGMSRYNLFTPKSVVEALRLLHRDYPEEWLFSIFPAGGRSGTLHQHYAGPRGKPYVFAKTGTLSNKHCLSGYLRTDSGRTLIFSFMHNNYVGGTARIKSEMEQVLGYVRGRL